MNRPDFPHISIDGSGSAHATLSLRVAFVAAPPARPPDHTEGVAVQAHAGFAGVKLA